jgi:hypothetical protein
MRPGGIALLMRTPLIKHGLDSRLLAIAEPFEAVRDLSAALTIFRGHVALGSTRERRSLADDMLEDLDSIRRNHL